ncbi:hypothetical protein H6758_04255 [Candidatus Nomurabacteria bacterium]|nr:hypothetical protein [Candidatus Nomurabacteria bacterium]
MKYQKLTHLFQKSALLWRKFLIFISKHKRSFAFFSVLLVIGTVGYAQTVDAGVLDIASGGSAYIVRGIIEAVSRIAVVVARLAVLLSIFFLRFFINIAAYNGYIDATTVQLGWTMVRDVANMFFVVALMAIAFMTILGAGGYEWKKAMGKLIFGAIFINFSNLICGIIIDAAYVFTITFLSAVVQAAGGNLINMFSLDAVLGLVQNTPDSDALFQNLRLELLAASFIMVMFGVLAAYTIGAYAIVMVIRMVVLWTLIILSPIAFLAQAIPKGEKFSSRWWSEFLKHVLVAPVMVFFLWLSFATLGNGNVFKDDIKPHTPPNIPPLDESVEQGNTLSLSISQISTWENMANFIIATAFLMVGLRMVRELGVEGGGVTQGAVNFAKNVATIATGVGLARKFAPDAGKKVGGALLERTGLPGGYNMLKGSIGRSLQRRGERVDQRGKGWERKGLLGTGNRFDKGLGKVASFLTETNMRKRKRSENWAEAAEYAKKRHEDNLGTSHSVSGKAKQDERIRADIMAEIKTTKGAQKAEKRRAEILEGTAGKAFEDEYRADKKIISDAVVGQKEAERRVSQATEELQRGEKEGIAAEQRKRLAHDTRLKGVDEDEALKMDEAMQAYRRTNEGRDLELRDTERQSIRADLEHEETMRTADEKDALAEKKSALDHLVSMDKGSIIAKDRLAQQQERQRQELAAEEHKYAKEETGFMLDALKARGQEQDAQLQHERDTDDTLSKLRAILENENEKRGIGKSKNDAEKRAELYRGQGDIGRAEAVISNALTQIAKQQQDLFSTMSYEQKMMMAQHVNKMVSGAKTDKEKNAAIQRSMGLMTSMLNSDAETGDAGFREALKASGWTEDINDDNRARAHYSAILGEVVQAGKEQEAIDKISGAFENSQEASAALRLYSDATKKFGMDGMGGSMGIIDKTITTDSKGIPTLTYRARAKQDAESGRYAAERLNVGNLTTLAGFANTDVDGTITGFSRERRGQVAQLFKGKNKLAISRLKASLTSGLSQAKVDKSNLMSYLRTWKDVVGVVEDRQAAEAFLNQISGHIKELASVSGKSEDQIRDMLLKGKK